jgi:hypothetical protein
VSGGAGAGVDIGTGAGAQREGAAMFGGGGLKLDKDLLAKVKKYAGIAGYATPEEFVRHVLEREIAKFEEGGDSEEEIRKRMQGLGYIS